MPFVSIVYEKDLKVQYDAMQELKDELKRSGLPKPDEIFIYQATDFHHQYLTSKGPTIIVAAKFKNEIAIKSVSYLTDSQLEIFSFFFEDTGLYENIIVFSEKDYNAIKKCLHNSKVKIKLI